MKKTLVALSVAAFAASANAVTVLDAEGTKVDFEGSLRLTLDQQSNKTKNAEGKLTAGTNSHAGDNNTNSHSRLHNTDSRFGVKVKHQLGEDFYALGRVEFRFDKGNSDDEFGDLYAKRAYVGLGSHQFGELTFGRQVTIADDLSQTDDYAYGLIPKGDYIPTSGTQVVRYDYRGVEGLQLSANYNFAENRDAAGEVLVNKVKNSYGVGALYNVGNADLRLAYGRTNYKVVGSKKHHQDGVLFSTSYALGDLQLIADTGYRYEKEQGAKTKEFYVSPGFAYQVIPASKVYGNYLYEHAKTKDTSKEKTHGFLLGVDYKFHKQVVAFVEGKYARTKLYNKVNNGYEYAEKTTDKAIGVGMRVFW